MKVKDPTSETAIKLIQSATELFNDFGYTGTSINDIAKKSKLSKGILYHYFQSKDDVYLFCLSECINNFVDFMERNISKISLSKETMTRVVELRFVFFDENPQYKNLFHNIISGKPTHLSKEISEIRQVLTENNISWIKLILTEINLGKDVLESDVSLFISILQNSSTFLLDAESDKKYRQDMINSIVRLTIIFLNGLREDLI
jgi:AcrR family transcriptional regulator